MALLQYPATALYVISLFLLSCNGAKINTPRVLLPWFENLNVNFTFEIIEGGCYTWSLSRDDIIDLEPLYEDTWGHCSRAARVSVSKTCAPPGSVIILAEEVNTGEILRGDVDIDAIKSLKVTSTTWKLFLEEAPEAFEVVAYDDQGNKFSTLEGLSFKWQIENLGNSAGEDNLVTLVRWRDTDYEAPRGVTELEALGLQAHSVLLYGQAMGECRVTVCIGDICNDFQLNVVASVVLTPATALIAPGDTLKYRVVRARAGRLTIQDIAETLYSMKVPDSIATLEDGVSLVRGTELGTTTVYLMSGVTEVATAVLNVVEPHSIRVSIRPSNLVIRGEDFIVHCIVLDKEGHPLTAGGDMLIRLTVDGEANIELLQSTENGTVTEAVAHNAGPFTVTANLFSVNGKELMKNVEGKTMATAVDPLEVVPPVLYVAWTDTTQEIQLNYIGGGDEPATWSEVEFEKNNAFSLTPTGMATVRGIGDVGVRVQLNKYPHVKAIGKVWSAYPEMIQVSSSGHARVGKPHHLHVALTATNPETAEPYLFNTCNCESFAVSLLEGPEPHNVTAVPWVQPLEGACCVLSLSWSTRGVCTVRVGRGRLGDAARVQVRAAPRVLWPAHAAALVGGTLPVLAEGEYLSASSSEPRTAELSARAGAPPHMFPDVELFTLKCRRKGEARVLLSTEAHDAAGGDERAGLDAACAPHVSRLRLEPPPPPGNCSAPAKVWLRPGQDLTVKVTLYDAIGRELLDELGPRMTWNVEPYHTGIEYKATDRLFVETHPDYVPVQVPFKFYQLVSAEEIAVGWTGTLKASIPDATASIQAKVVAPLKVDPLKINVAWEGEWVRNVAVIRGGSGRYSVEAPKGVTAEVEGEALHVAAPAPGSYDLVVTDQCVYGERQVIEVHIEEIAHVEVVTSRAVCEGACVPLAAVARGASAALAARRPPHWRHAGQVIVKDNQLCGVKEGTGKVWASLGGVWSQEVEVVVFPPLVVIPAVLRLPPGARAQLRARGGPPPHLAARAYRADPAPHVQVSQSGLIQGVAPGTARVRLVATDIANVVMASAEAEVEVIPISGLRVRAATQNLLVGSPGPMWLEASSLSASSLASLHPLPRVTWSVRDPSSARLYSSHVDDQLERSVAEGLSVRVVPLKPGVITIDVRARNLGQVSEVRSWDSTIEVLGIADIRTSIEGLQQELSAGDRVALAVGSSIRLKSLPRGSWKAYGEGFEVHSNGEVKGLSPGHGIIVAQHKDERNNIYRETAIHIEVAVPHYCTAEPSAEGEDGGVLLALRDAVGRRLLAPLANVSASETQVAGVRRPADSALGSELLLHGVESPGAFMTFQATTGDVTVTDEVWVAGLDNKVDRYILTAGWAACVEGTGWRAGAGMRLWPAPAAAPAPATLALAVTRAPARHALSAARPPRRAAILQRTLTQFEFTPGDWPASLVPLTLGAADLSGGPFLCTEEQRYALDGVEIELPFVCRTQQPHTAQPAYDIVNNQIGCQIIPSGPITEASEVELCAEWDVSRTCTRVLLLPSIQVSQTKVSLLHPPTIFTITGHPTALRLVKIKTSPGLKSESNLRNGEIGVVIKGETSTCGLGWVIVKSRLTGQEIRVEVERECDVACGTLLGAIFSLVKPYLSTLVTIAAVAAGFMYLQTKLGPKTQIRLPTEPTQTVLPGADASPAARVRTWSRSPYASAGPAGPGGPVYGDASTLPDNSFSPNTTRMHSRFL